MAAAWLKLNASATFPEQNYSVAKQDTALKMPVFGVLLW